MSNLGFVGFCAKCGIVRQDVDGKPVTDCICTASKMHTAECAYLLGVSCPIDVGIRCTTHGRWPCLECDCDCGAHL